MAASCQKSRKIVNRINIEDDEDQVSDEAPKKHDETSFDEKLIGKKKNLKSKSRFKAF